MKRQVVSIVVLCCLLTGVPASVGGYYHGKKTGKEIGQKVGYDEGYTSAPKATAAQIYAEQNYDNMINDYNKLVEDYNSLRKAAIQYVNTSSYQSRSPVTCNTRNYSYTNSSTTTCY